MQGLPNILCVREGIDRIGHSVRIADDVSVYRRESGNGLIAVGDEAVLHQAVRLVIGDRENGGAASLVIGARTHVNAGAYLSGEGGLEIGADVLIGPHARILSAGHDIDGTHPIIAHEALTFGAIVIGEGAWIGAGATVLQGVTIGRGAVVAAGAVVTRDVPEFVIVAGIPAQFLRYRKGFIPEPVVQRPSRPALLPKIADGLRRTWRCLKTGRHVQ